MANPAKLIAARYIVDYLKATRHLGSPVKDRIGALQDAALVTGILNKECIDAHALANALKLFGRAVNRVEPSIDDTDSV